MRVWRRCLTPTRGPAQPVALFPRRAGPDSGFVMAPRAGTCLAGGRIVLGETPDRRLRSPCCGRVCVRDPLLSILILEKRAEGQEDDLTMFLPWPGRAFLPIEAGEFSPSSPRSVLPAWRSRGLSRVEPSLSAAFASWLRQVPRFPSVALSCMARHERLCLGDSLFLLEGQWTYHDYGLQSWCLKR